jgi:hypothetical protein
MTVNDVNVLLTFAVLNSTLTLCRLMMINLVHPRSNYRFSEPESELGLVGFRPQTLDARIAARHRQVPATHPRQHKNQQNDARNR